MLFVQLMKHVFDVILVTGLNVGRGGSDSITVTDWIGEKTVIHD